ncbi:MAG: epoxide hydrolase 1, partial [Mesorhizobium sp.]
MPASSPSLTRRSLLAASVAAGALSLLPARARASVDIEAVHPFRVDFLEEAILDLRRRLATTRWPLRETVTELHALRLIRDGFPQGVQLPKLQDLLRYWMTDYNWREVEAKLNALPMFVTEIDGVAIHFIHVRSPHANAMPMIMTHGWPGSILEFMKVIGPLTDPAAHGGASEDAFDLVVPSIPGFGFSGKPTETGWGSDHIGRAWGVLMGRLGYDRYVSQDGDCGSVISHRMALQKVPGLIGIHVNMPGTVPKEIAAILAAGGPAPSELSEDESAA